MIPEYKWRRPKPFKDERKTPLHKTREVPNRCEMYQRLKSEISKLNLEFRGDGTIIPNTSPYLDNMST
jgi:hypothetical protein